MFIAVLFTSVAGRVKGSLGWVLAAALSSSWVLVLLPSRHVCIIYGMHGSLPRAGLRYKGQYLQRVGTTVVCVL